MNFVETFRYLFPAQLTAKEWVIGSGSSSGTGQWQYAWVEQQFDTTTGVYSDADCARHGSVTLNYATEINDNEAPLFVFVWLKLKGIVSGQPVYEFVWQGGEGGSSSSGSESSSGSASGSASGSGGSGSCSGFSGVLSRWRYQCEAGALNAYVTQESYTCGSLESVAPEAFSHQEGCCECGSGSGSGSSSGSGSGSSSGSITCGPVTDSVALMTDLTCDGSGLHPTYSTISFGSGSGSCTPFVSAVSCVTGSGGEPQLSVTISYLIVEANGFTVADSCDGGSGSVETCVACVLGVDCLDGLRVTIQYLVWTSGGFQICDGCP